MKPFLFLSARPEVEAVGPEYESVRRAMGVDAGRLEHLRLDADSLARDFRIDAFAGVMVGGSPFNVTTPDAAKPAVQRRVEADLARVAEAALERDHPLLLTCYGIGVLTRVIGGTVGTEYGEETAAVEITLTPDGADDPLSACCPSASTPSSATRRPPSDCPTTRCCSRRRADAPCRSTGWAAACTRRSSTPRCRPPTSSPARRCTATTATSRRANCVR